MAASVLLEKAERSDDNADDDVVNVPLTPFRFDLIFKASGAEESKEARGEDEETSWIRFSSPLCPLALTETTPF